MILTGLKNKFGARCEVAYPLELPGMRAGPSPASQSGGRRIFNIYRVMDDSLRSPNEKTPDLRRITQKIAAREYDIVHLRSSTVHRDLFRAGGPRNYSKGEGVLHQRGGWTYRRFPDGSLLPWKQKVQTAASKSIAAEQPWRVANGSLPAAHCPMAETAGRNPSQKAPCS